MTDPMPNTPVTRGDVVSLAQQVGELQGDVHTLTDTMREAIQQANEAKAEAKAAKTSADSNPSREEVRSQRKKFIIWGVVLILVSMCLGIFTTTTMVTRCFLEPPKHGAWLATCNAIPGYRNSEDQNQRNLDQFNKLLAEIPKNRTENAQQQVQINRIKRRLHMR